MKNLFEISIEEKNRILEMHINATKKQYLVESNQTLNITVKDIKVQGRKVGDDNIYNVATSDYLSNGGGNLEFFKKGVASHDNAYNGNIFYKQ